MKVTHDVRNKILKEIRDRGRNGAAKFLGVGGQTLHAAIQPNGEVREESLAQITKALA